MNGRRRCCCETSHRKSRQNDGYENRMCARGLDTLAPDELPVYVRRTARVRTQENSACMH